MMQEMRAPNRCWTGPTEEENCHDVYDPFPSHPGTEALRRIDTASTVPDIGLECFLFLKRLVGDHGHDFDERADLRQYIFDWMAKMESWAGSDDYLNEFNEPIQGMLRDMLFTARRSEELEIRLSQIHASEVEQVKAVEKGYDIMLLKQKVVSEKKCDSEEVIAAKHKTLMEWKEAKIGSICGGSTKLKSEIDGLQVKLRTSMDAMIEEVSLAHALEFEDPMATEPVPSNEDVVMRELEDLMNDLSFDKTDELARASILSQKTQVLGEVDQDTPAIESPDSQPLSDVDAVMEAPVHPASPSTFIPIPQLMASRGRM